jgi:hypothetical protein
MKQSRIMSLVEAAANVVVGYGLAIATQIVVFPWFGIETGLAEHLTIGLAFVDRLAGAGYLLRRLFETIRIRNAEMKSTPPHAGRRHREAELLLERAGEGAADRVRLMPKSA